MTEEVVATAEVVRGTALNSQRFVRVPADQILHLKLTDRWPQTRGERRQSRRPARSLRALHEEPA